ncbi:polysaccharide pyruvyl transferase family protein [Formosa undariae]|uniref:Polysaccharide pyruvyl transferase family protein n=1 Tax=Formosa undariae TaxID=1325436 RepID=A0ABV5F5X4_9FLAO
MDKKEIYILSASDRFNYGDLLFPIIAKKALASDEFTFFNVGCVRSDLSNIGALPTCSYDILYKNASSNASKVILVAGGEVLMANWSRLYSFIWPFYFKLYEKARIRKKLSLLEKFTIKLKGHKDNIWPFIPSGTKISDNYSLVFNAVGGNNISSEKNNTKISKALNASLFFSAREQKTYNALSTNFNINDLRLSPDSAIIMSDYFKFDAVVQEEYIAFQIGHHKNGNSLDLINEQLKLLSQETGLPIYFVSIGNCPGHDDMDSLNYLAERAEYANKVIDPVSVEYIMEVIAKSKLFMGTSLHGVITSMSFETPFVALNPKIDKLKDYIDTWISAPFNRISEFKNIKEEAMLRLNCENKEDILKDSITKQKDLIKNNFIEIKNRIESL